MKKIKSPREVYNREQLLTRPTLKTLSMITTDISYLDFQIIAASCISAIVLQMTPLKPLVLSEIVVAVSFYLTHWCKKEVC